MIGEFVEWLNDRGVQLCNIPSFEDLPGNKHYYPIHTPMEELLAEFFNIDLAELDREKAAILEEIRSAQDEASVANP